MTDKDTTNDVDADAQIEEAPELLTLQVRAVRHYEVDVPKQTLQQLADGDESPITALEEELIQQEAQAVAPEEKLLFVDVEANETSNN